MLQTIKQGGWIMWPIVAVSFVIWWLGLWKMYSIISLAKARRRFLSLCCQTFRTGKQQHRSTGNDGYDDLLRYIESDTISCKAFSARFREFLTEQIERLGSGLPTIAALVSVAPLLGLLGTVAGMIETFRIITLFGSGNPALTAEGISIALLTTEAGLTAAFPGMLLHAFVNNRKNSLQRRMLADGERLMQKLTLEKKGG